MTAPNNQPAPEGQRQAPYKQWSDLKAQVLTEIQQIDNNTKWSEVEPEWWLEMMDVQRLLQKRL